MKILVVDDEQLVRWFLDRALSRSGYEVVTAANIVEASSRLEKENIGILFLDLRMPEGNGIELIKQIRSKPNKPKIVVCSAFITADLEQEFRNEGICVLKKPFKLDELNKTLKDCVET